MVYLLKVKTVSTFTLVFINKFTVADTQGPGFKSCTKKINLLMLKSQFNHVYTLEKQKNSADKIRHKVEITNNTNKYTITPQGLSGAHL